MGGNENDRYFGKDMSDFSWIFNSISVSNLHIKYNKIWFKFIDDSIYCYKRWLISNSVAYTDSCLGQFIDEFKKTKLWDNTLIVLVPDHSFIYPSNMNNAEPDRYHIPMVWAGGAVNGPIKVDTYGSQIDIAATLLNEMNIDASDFKFSKNLRSNLFNKFAYYSFKGGFGILNDSSASVFNLDSQEPFDLQTISIDKNR